jgi:UPF0271 protein
VAERALRLATSGEVVALTGEVIPVRVESLCLHGDTPGAVRLAARVRETLERAHISLNPF